jgi:hypothetical protein
MIPYLRRKLSTLLTKLHFSPRCSLRVHHVGVIICDGWIELSVRSSIVAHIIRFVPTLPARSATPVQPVLIIVCDR